MLNNLLQVNPRFRSPDSMIVLSKYNSTQKDVSEMLLDVQNMESSWILHDLDLVVINSSLEKSKFYLTNSSTPEIQIVDIENSSIRQLKVRDGCQIIIRNSKISIIEAEHSVLELHKVLFVGHSTLKIKRGSLNILSSNSPTEIKATDSQFLLTNVAISAEITATNSTFDLTNMTFLPDSILRLELCLLYITASNGPAEITAKESRFYFTNMTFLPASILQLELCLLNITASNGPVEITAKESRFNITNMTFLPDSILRLELCLLYITASNGPAEITAKDSRFYLTNMTFLPDTILQLELCLLNITASNGPVEITAKESQFNITNMTFLPESILRLKLCLLYITASNGPVEIAATDSTFELTNMTFLPDSILRLELCLLYITASNGPTEITAKESRFNITNMTFLPDSILRLKLCLLYITAFNGPVEITATDSKFELTNMTFLPDSILRLELCLLYITASNGPAEITAKDSRFYLTNMTFLPDTILQLELCLLNITASDGPVEIRAKDSELHLTNMTSVADRILISNGFDETEGADSHLLLIANNSTLKIIGSDIIGGIKGRNSMVSLIESTLNMKTRDVDIKNCSIRGDNNSHIWAQYTNITIQQSYFLNIRMMIDTDAEVRNILNIENSAFHIFLSNGQSALCINGVDNITIHKSEFVVEDDGGCDTIFDISDVAHINVVNSSFLTEDATHFYISNKQYEFSAKGSIFRKGNITLLSNQSHFLDTAVDAGIIEVFSADVKHNETTANERKGNESGVIIGIAVGALILVFSCFLVFIYLVYRKRAAQSAEIKKETTENNESNEMYSQNTQQSSAEISANINTNDPHSKEKMFTKNNSNRSVDGNDTDDTSDEHQTLVRDNTKHYMAWDHR